MKFEWYKGLALIIILLTFSFVGVQYHEDAHEQISKNFGCIQPVVTNDLFKGSFYCKQYSPLVTEEDRRMEATLHSLNEVVGYHLNIFLGFVLVVIFVVWLLWGDRE